MHLGYAIGGSPYSIDDTVRPFLIDIPTIDIFKLYKRYEISYHIILLLSPKNEDNT